MQDNPLLTPDNPMPLPKWASEIVDKINLPKEWAQIASPLPNTGIAFAKKTVFPSQAKMLFVILTADTELDGRRWLHLSVSAKRDYFTGAASKSEIPTWEDLLEVKNLIIGEEREAIQKLPKQSEYVNICRFALHLWHCLDQEVTPDFTRGLGTI